MPLEEKQAVKSYWASHGCAKPYTRRQARAHIRRALMARRRVRRYIICAHTRRSARKLRTYLSRYRKVVAYRRALYAVTPYQCGSHGRFAIPCQIIACESGFSWSAYNPSGAAGVYQLMSMHGRPFPVRSKWDKLRHHQIAFNLYAGGRGRGAWVC